MVKFDRQHMSINNLSKYGKCRENSCVCIGRCSASEWPELLIQYNKYSPKKFKASRYATFIISQLSATHVLRTPDRSKHIWLEV